MISQPNASNWTVADYLAFEPDSPDKHEYLNGQVYPVYQQDVQAMAGASEAHVLIAGNMFSALHVAFQRRNCRVYQSDLRVKAHDTAYFYPDIVAVCGDSLFVDDTRQMLTNPLLVIEVLSPSTADFDRGGKFLAYRQCASLQEYVLVAQDTQHIEQYQRQADNTWTLQDIDSGSVHLASVDVTLALRTIYNGVTL